MWLAVQLARQPLAVAMVVGAVVLARPRRRLR